MQRTENFESLASGGRLGANADHATLVSHERSLVDGSMLRRISGARQLTQAIYPRHRTSRNTCKLLKIKDREPLYPRHCLSTSARDFGPILSPIPAAPPTRRLANSPVVPFRSIQITKTSNPYALSRGYHRRLLKRDAILVHCPPEGCVVDPLPSNDPGTQKRRSTRIVQAIPIVVTGVDALGQPFKERTTTVMVNCHGCKYQSKHYVPKNSTITLEIPRPEPGQTPRSVQGRVVWVQRPRTVRELFQIALEFEVAGNIWGIAFPPEDWFPSPDADQPKAVQEEELEISSGEPAAVETRAEAAADAKLHVVPSAPALQSPEAHQAAAKQMAQIVAEAKDTLDKTARKAANSAVNDEMTVVRQQLDVQLHEAVEHAIKVSMERVSESAVKRVVQQAAERTSAIVDDARKASALSAETLDAKIRDAVQQAVSEAAEQASRQAAQQAAALNLQQTVEDAVERIISEREASSPSLQILSSPDAAQQQVDQWKKNLEDAAQGVRKQAAEQLQADSTAASERWKETFEAAVSNASQTLGQKLDEAAQSATAKTEQAIGERAAGVHKSIDDAIASAQARIQSLGADLEQERTRTEAAKSQLQEAADSAIEQTRQRLDDILASQQQEIARRADQAVAQRAQQIEPLLRESAEGAISQFTAELDRTLSARRGEAQQAAADLAVAREHAEQLQDALREQLKQAAERAAQIENSVREQAARVAGQTAQIQNTVREKIQEASQQAMQESLARLQQEVEKYPAEVEQASRAVASKFEEEMEQKATETQHAAYEELVKASDWYSKKAHATMQSSLEKSVEQASSDLRHRAAEVSSLVASELDHYGRTYVEHSRAQIEEAAKEVSDRERAKFSERAEMAGASFTDRVQRATSDSLKKFEEASRAALEKARSDIEFNREGSLAQFQKNLDDMMIKGVEQAQTYLQSQLVPLLEEWEKRRQEQMMAWIVQAEKSSNESIEQYKARLENASNSWLLASATTLGQHSQAVLDTLAKSAEKRIRDTCAEVLAGMGDTIKERLMGISGKFQEDDEDDPPRKKK